MVAKNTATHLASKYQVARMPRDDDELKWSSFNVRDRRGKVLVPNYPHLAVDVLLSDVENLSRKIEKCFEATNLRIFDGLSIKVALNSAISYVREFRKVIPLSFQPNSHCWKMSYEVHTKGQHIWGHIGNITFNKVLPVDYRSSLLGDIQNDFKNHFTSKTVCLPTLFLLGFPKCGSTFLWCLINKVVQDVIRVKPASFKEPGWWYERRDTDVKTLDVSELGRYIANFATPINAVDTSEQTNLVIADGTPGVAYATPRFNKRDPLQLNYCLLPTAIPHLLPHAKFIMIMREPADALYSLFWWACKGRLTNKTQKAVPNVFHKVVMSKMDIFNKCMRDEKIQEISHTCSMSSPDYGLCITHPKRLALLDKCVAKMGPEAKGSGLPSCAKIGFNMYLYYIHVRRWLSVTPRHNFYFLTINDTSDPVEVSRRVLEMMDIPLPTDFDPMKAYSECQRRKNKQKISYSSSATLQMRTDTKAYLEKFFAPFNKMLSELLGDPKYLFT